MPGRYGSRATKFLYLDGARMTGADAPLTSSESETELLTEKYMPEGAKRGVVVQSGLSNEMITLEGYARRDSGAANLILSGDAHAVAPTPERMVTVGDFGDIVGQQAVIHRAMRLAESWKTIPGDILLQFSGTLKTARGHRADVQEGTIIRAMSQTVADRNSQVVQLRARLVDLGAASTDGFVIGYHIERIEFKDRAEVALEVSHSATLTATLNLISAGEVVIASPGADGVVGPLSFWRRTTGAARRYIAPAFSFRGTGTATDTSVTYHVSVARL